MDSSQNSLSSNMHMKTMVTNNALPIFFHSNFYNSNRCSLQLQLNEQDNSVLCIAAS